MPAQIAARGGVEIGVFDLLFWDLSPQGGRNRVTVVIPALPEVPRGDSRRFFPRTTGRKYMHFAIEVAAAAFSAILIGLTTQLGAAGGGLLEGSVEGSVGGRRIHFYRREIGFWTSLSRTEPVLNTLIFG